MAVAGGARAAKAARCHVCHVCHWRTMQHSMSAMTQLDGCLGRFGTGRFRRRTAATADQGAGGPWVEWSWVSRDRHRRATALGAAGVAAAAVMAFAGLPPADLHGVLHHLGVMDPLCGATRSARLAAQGRLSAAWQYNPVGIAADLAAALTVLRAAGGWLTGRWLDVTLSWTPGRRRVVLWVGLVLLLALEIRQQLRADLLIRRY